MGGTISVAVGKATPSVSTVPSASVISFGQALSSSALTGGTGSVTGLFAFAAPSTVPGAAGSYAAAFTFLPTDGADYTTVSGTVSVTVGKATPSITTVPAASGISYGQTLSSSTLTGGAGSVSGSFSFTAPATIPPGTIPSGGTFSAPITFTPSDPADYTTVAGWVGVAVSAVDGSCGSSNGVMFLAAPSQRLCSAGAATTLWGIGPWNWNCNGSVGRLSASCSAAKLSSTTSAIPSAGLPAVDVSGVKAGSNFTIYRAEGGNAPVSMLTSSSTSYTDNSPLKPNTIYQYLVTSDTDATQTVFMTVHTPMYNGWNIIAVPYNTTGVSPATLFGSSVGSIYQWLPSGATPESSNSFLGSYATVTNLVPGNGYFVKTANSNTMLVYAGTPSPASATVTLKPGWTMIANPQTTDKADIATNWSIDGDSLGSAIINNKIGGSVYWWNGTTYDSWTVLGNNPQIEPWKGYWILNLDPVNHTLTIL